MNKDERLAAAKRKLKEFQKQQKSLMPKSPDKENRENAEIALRTSQHDLPFSKQELTTPVSSEDFERLSVGPTSSDTRNSSTAQQPSLANYFQRSSSGNEIFFDTVHKRVNGDANCTTSIISASPVQYSTNNMSTSVLQPSTVPSTSTFFSLGGEKNFISSNFPPMNQTIDFNEGHSTENQIGESNVQELNALKLELELANSRIKMQSNALDIITAEKEDLQTKLTKAVQEIDSYERNTRSLNTQLEENFSHMKQFEVTVEELKRFKDNAATKEFAIEQSLSDIQEKNEELVQSLINEKENNKVLQSQLDETRSNYSLLALKFQQLGIEVNSDPNKDYKSVHDECESWKRKYHELEGRLTATIYEKERTEDEYRQFVANLKQEVENANSEVRQLSDENQVLASKIASQTEHISSLERQVQKTSTDTNKDATIAELLDELQKLRQEKETDREMNAQLTAQLTELEATKRRVFELENQIVNLMADMTNAQELQMAVESNKVAASQAIAQNAKMKAEFEQLHQLVQTLNEDKIMLSKMLEEEKTKNVNSAIVTQNENEIDYHEKLTNDAAINTDAEEEGSENGAYGKANVEAMLLLQEKFKSVLDKMADLTDEKQQLEHLVLQLQSETETIEEYVALYQKQRALLQQRARETDLKMENVSQEKERLLNILRLILTTDNFDCAFVKQLVESNLSVELSSESVNRSSGAAQQYNSFLPKNDNNHHPSCPCCSGQLITV